METNAVIINHAGDESGFKSVRKDHIGSSDIATIVGVNEFETKYELWLQKTGRVPEKQMNQAMLMGHLLEPVAAELFKMQYVTDGFEFAGGTVERCQNTYEMESPFQFASCTPDYFLIDPAGQRYILEIKTTSEYGRKKWEADLPDYAHVQVIWQMGILGIKKAIVACLIGGRDMVIWPVDFSQELFEQLLSHGAAFWEMVKQEIPPETVSTTELSIREFDEEEADLPTIEPLMAEYLEAKKEQSENSAIAKKLEAKSKALKAKVMLAMGRYGRVTAGGLVAIKKEIHKESYTVKASRYTDLSVKQI